MYIKRSKTMNVKYPLIALLAILFSVQSYAQEETVKSTSLGIITNFDVFDEVSFGDQTNQFLLSLYVDRDVNSRFSLGLRAGVSREVLGFGTHWYPDSPEYYGLELFSRINVHNTKRFEVYARPSVAYQLSNFEYWKLIKTAADLGISYDLKSRFNLILEKEVISYNYLKNYDYSTQEIYFNSFLEGFRAGIEFEF